MHAVHLSGSHYSQYLGLSAGITALIMALQTLATAMIAWRWMGERLSPCNGPASWPALPASRWSCGTRST
jgi:hypothetical protein